MALILPNSGIIGPNVNPLAFPAGIAPGFDPTHVAAQNPVFSGVASGGNFVSIFGSPGMAGTVSGPPSAVTDGFIGNATKYGGAGGHGSDLSYWSGIGTSASGSDFTAAAIFTPQQINSSELIILNGLVASANGLFINANGTSNDIDIIVNGTTSTTIVGIPIGTPTFLVVSWSQSLGKWNFVFVNLRTGVILSATTSLSATSSTGGGIYVGNSSSANRPLNGLIAAASYSNCYLSPSKLAQWASDPWSFWYPRRKTISSFSPPGPEVIYLDKWYQALSWIGRRTVLLGEE